MWKPLILTSIPLLSNGTGSGGHIYGTGQRKGGTFMKIGQFDKSS
jgi:hypothetical protein